jgi:nitrite reductase/ring-hydroxylating ferredoxin subunit
MPWLPVARTEECPVGSSIERVVADRVVAIFNVAGAYYALEFDVRDGRSPLNARVVQPSFATRVEGDEILIELP